jgi:ribose 5-phosphate isomerase B
VPGDHRRGPADEDRVCYPVYAAHVVRLVAGGAADVGVLVCGSGAGMSIAANRHPMIRAGLVHHTAGARPARQHNAANVLCLAPAS